MAPTKDRNDYRSMDTAALCEETRYARNPNWEELAIALAERLEQKQRRLQDYHYDLRAERNDYVEGAN
jgi:hypothetical protein